MDLREFITSIITNILKPVTWLILSLAVVYFLWNIMQIIRKSDQPGELDKLKSQATWGIVAIFVMVSLWGLVNILINTFQPSTQLEFYPQLPTSGGGAPRGASSGSTGGTFDVPAGGFVWGGSGLCQGACLYRLYMPIAENRLSLVV